MNDFMRPALYGAEHEIITLKKSKGITKNAFEFVDKYNSKAKFRRGIASLRNLGFKATWKRVFSHFYSKIAIFLGIISFFYDI